jgi:coenzyme F420-reducing hydrogenase delta subunit
MTRRILVVSCNWDGWSCIDAALNSGKTIPGNVSITKIPCISGINSGYILRAFESSADAIMVVGCLNEKCQYGQCNGNIDLEITSAAEILSLLGAEKGTILMTRLAAFDGKSFLEQLNEFADSISQKNVTC